MGKFTKLRDTAFKEMQLGAGVLMRQFDPETASIELANILAATTGGMKFSAVPRYTDFGADIDNCPENMAELKRLDDYEIKLTGNMVSITPDIVKSLFAAAEVALAKITPRTELKIEDFTDLWFVGDYSDDTSEENGGFVAIHMMKTLSTGGFQMQTGKKNKGQFAFEYMAHYSISAQDVVPVEVFVKAGGAAA